MIGVVLNTGANIPIFASEYSVTFTHEEICLPKNNAKQFFNV